MNYNTQRIINAIKDNYNDRGIIIYNAHEYAGEGVPVNPEALIQPLNELFNQGALILLETRIGYDDEGGESYDAFVLKPELINHHADYVIEHDRMPYVAAAMKYITEFPENVAHVWAGPF